MSLFRKKSVRGENDLEYQCTIRFLDDADSMQVTYKKDLLGQWLLDQVCTKLNIVEKDYFGLRFVDTDKQRHWLDPLKNIHKQIKAINPQVLCFRVKFYPLDPMKLHEEITRYQLFLQLRRDLHHGRLLCSQNDANLLAAYVIQSEVGDYDPQDCPIGYVTKFNLLPKQNPKMEEEIIKIHQTLTNQVPADSEANFLRKAATLDTYGVDPHQVKDQKGSPMYLGITHQGIMTFQGSRRTQLYKWNMVRRLLMESKMFIVHVNISEDEDTSNAKKRFGGKRKQQPVGYKTPTVASCKYLWKCAVEQQMFFTLASSINAPKLKSGGNVFSRGSKFRFSGRCQNEAISASENIKREEPDFSRTSSLPNFTRKRQAQSMDASIISCPVPAPRFNDHETPVKTAKKEKSAKPEPAQKPMETEITATVEIPVETAKPAEIVTPVEIIKDVVDAKPVENEITSENTKPTENEKPVENEKDGEKVVVNEACDMIIKTMTENPVDVGEQHINVPDVVQAGPLKTAPPNLGMNSIPHNGILASEDLIKSATVGKMNAPIPDIHVSPVDDSMDITPDYNPDETNIEEEEEPTTPKRSIEDQLRDLDNINEDLIKANHVSPTHKTDVKQAQKSSKSGTCCKALAYGLIGSLFLFTIGVTIVFYLDVKHPLVKELRHQLHFIEPARDYIHEKMQTVFKS